MKEYVARERGTGLLADLAPWVHIAGRPACSCALQWFLAREDTLGQDLDCPNCGKPVKLNPLTVNANWRPMAAAWRGYRHRHSHTDQRLPFAGSFHFLVSTAAERVTHCYMARPPSDLIPDSLGLLRWS